MRGSYFEKLIKYIRNVYDIDKVFNDLTDTRVYPKYKTKQIATILLIGFLLRIESFNDLKLMLGEKRFSKLFPKGTDIPKIDTFRDTSKTMCVELLQLTHHSFIKMMRRNKVFDNGTIAGLMVCAIDGTTLFGSYNKHCDSCLTTTIKGRTFYYHSCTVMSSIGNGPKIVFDFEMQNPAIDSASKDEGELNASKRLLKRVAGSHKGLVDIVVYDALACNSIWINHCRNLGVDLIVRVKENNVSSVKQVKKKTNKQEPAEVWMNKKGFERVEVFESTFRMDHVDRPLRFVKFAMKYPSGKHSQIMIVTTCMDLSLAVLLKMIRARWNIENSIFNNLKTNCFLDHCFVHGENAVEVLLYLQFMASNFMQLFMHRRIHQSMKTQKQLVKLLLEGLHDMKRSPERMFSSA